ncbi:MAG: ABC transporter ATP-binding protein [Bacillota bacterium]|nr:ABC transporter ATP-binding protein [Bacillota bacterium]
MARRESVIEKPKGKPKKIFRRLLKYAGLYKWAFLFALLLSIISNLLSLVGPKLSGSAIDAIGGRGSVDFDKVFYYAKLMLIFYIASSVLSYALSILMMNIGRNITRGMRNEVFEKLMTLPVGYFDRHQAGDIISRVSYDIDVINSSLSTDVVQILSSIITVVGSLAMMISVCPILVIVVLITIPMSVIYTKYMTGRTRPLFSKRSAKYGEMNGFTEEMFSGQKTICAYAHEEKTMEDFDKINEGAVEAYFDAEYYGTMVGPTVNFINNFSLALIATFGSLLYMGFGGISITLGQISSFVLYSRKFSGPINEAANIISDFQSALAAAERVFKVLDEEEEVQDIEGAAELNEVQGNVELQSVSFGYTKDKTIIHDLNLKALAGKLTAIVGPTGAGKTTIINLLMRFYDVQKGSILVDDKEIKTITRKSLRKAYAMVLQDTWVFRGTVFENIAYGKENATKEEVINAAKAARIHTYIMRLPKGYDTVIGEDGVNISKGQRQLLTIARAMLLDAKMLILDEATSNVDTRTEIQIQQAMRELMHDKTCFVIAHRLSTVRNADNILVVNNGDVVEQGTHDSLMNKKGFYYKLYASQFE